MSLTIVWSAILESSEDPCVQRRSTPLHSVLVPEPQDAAATVMKWWLEDTEPGSFNSNWDVEVGDGEDEVTAVVVIHDPPGLAGFYAVNLERTIQARGYHAAPEDIERLKKLLPDKEAA